MSRKAFSDLGQRRRRQIFRKIFRRADAGNEQQDMQIERSLSPYQREIHDTDTEEENASNYADDDEYYNITTEEEQTETEEEYENMENEIEEYEELAQNNNDEFYDDQALYLGAPLTISHSMLSILTLLLHHNINMLCLSDIITVINLHCLPEQLKKNSLHKFRKYFSLKDTYLQKHYYCSFCTRDLKSIEDICPSCPRKNNSYFVELSFLEQLREMYKRNGFYNQLQKRFERIANLPDVITDVYDGSLYRKWVDNGFLRNPDNISFSWYTDGVPVFKSSKISMWPLYLTINELPFNERKKRKNTLLLGLWYGDKKPNANSFIYKFREALEEISKGIEIEVKRYNNIELKTIRGVLLMGTADLPAKSDFLNFVQFNGDYGCPSCYCKGENVSLIPKGSVHVYRYKNELKLRSLNECIEYANRASLDNPVMGIKGHTAFSKLMPDFIEGVGIDRIHCVDSGVVKKMLSLWFDVKYRGFPFSLYAVVDVVNSRLIAIKPPKYVHRMPRCIQDLLHWKASKLKTWFFHYSVPVLEGILRQDYFNHYLLLVVAISMLNSEEISFFMINIARDFLNKFVREFEHLYGLQFCSINIHQLRHLPDNVIKMGPLWVFSCFEYENLNGQLLKLVHGTRHIETQIYRATAHEQFIKMIRLIDEMPIGPVHKFCLSKKRQVKIIEQIFPNCYSVGAYKKLQRLPNIITTAMCNSRIPETVSWWQYFRLLKNSYLYVSQMYKTDLQTESSIIQYVNNEDQTHHAEIQCFIKTIHQNCNEQFCQCEHRERHYAIAQQISTDDAFLVRGDYNVADTNFFLHKCHKTDNFTAIPIEKLKCVCVYMKIDNQMYIGIPINQKELE
nr:PREDICTED: uncharacterized protein LOC105679152 [Linepithema humile]